MSCSEQAFHIVLGLGRRLQSWTPPGTVVRRMSEEETLETRLKQKILRIKN
jgi:hypothetical protein